MPPQVRGPSISSITVNAKIVTIAASSDTVRVNAARIDPRAPVTILITSVVVTLRILSTMWKRWSSGCSTLPGLKRSRV